MLFVVYGCQTDEPAAADLPRWSLLALGGTGFMVAGATQPFGVVRAFWALYIIYIQYHPSKSAALYDVAVDICGFMQPIQTAQARSFHCANVNDYRSFPMKIKCMPRSLTYWLLIYQIDSLIRSWRILDSCSGHYDGDTVLNSSSCSLYCS